jgi:hypothetical protein
MTLRKKKEIAGDISTVVGFQIPPPAKRKIGEAELPREAKMLQDYRKSQDFATR